MQPEPGPQPWATPPTHPATQQHQPPPWMVQYQPNAPVAHGRGGPRKALIIGAIAVVGLLGAGTAGVDAFARHEICSALEGDSSLTGAAGAEAPTEGQFAQIRRGADEMRGYGRMLVLHRDLGSAVSGLADDTDQLVGVLSATGTGSVEQIAAGGGMAELLTLAGSVNSHARVAQQACGLPVTGIFRK